MKIVALVLTASLISGCATTSLSVDKIDAAIQKSAPAVCKAVQAAYAGYVAIDKGSAKDKAIIQSAYEATVPICDNPSTATSSQLVSLGIKLSTIIAAIRRVKAAA